MSISKLLKSAIIKVNKKKDLQIKPASFLVPINTKILNQYGLNCIPHITETSKAITIQTAGIDSTVSIPYDEDNLLPIEKEGDVCFGSQKSGEYVKFDGDGGCKIITKEIQIEAGSILILNNISNQLGKVIEALNSLSGNIVNVPSLGIPTPLTISGQLISVVNEMSELKNQLDQVI